MSLYAQLGDNGRYKCVPLYNYIHAESKKHHNCSKLVLISLRPCSTIKVTSQSNFYLIYRNICLVAFPENIQWVNLNRSIGIYVYLVCILLLISILHF